MDAAQLAEDKDDNDDVLRDMDGNVICGDDTDPEILGLDNTQVGQASKHAGLSSA